MEAKFNHAFFYTYVSEGIRAKKEELTAISPNMLKEAKELVQSIRKDKNINYSFTNKNKNIENIFQYKLEFKYEGIKFLGYIDILQINHKNKTIQIKDLKTTSLSNKKFVSSFLKWNYYIQAGLYSIGTEQIIKDLKLDDYEILPFEFVYSSFMSNSTITYVFTDKWLSGSINGFFANGRYYKGIKELIRDIKWHYDNDVFTMNRYLHEQNSKIEIPNDFIKITEDRNEGE